MPFQKAVKRNSKLRMAIAGIAGSGKTFTSLTLATALAKGSSIALIDTEHGSASKYADQFSFDSLELSNFDPRNYINAIHEAERDGYAVLIIDSLSHAWNGTGGALELVESIARKVAARRDKTPNTFNAWSDVTPLQNKLIDTILASSIHIIATMRSKTEYIVEKDADGKQVPRKVGMAPIQRADVEYEFDIYADMDAANNMIIQKSRCSALYGQIYSKPESSLAEVIQTWLKGKPEETVEIVSHGEALSVPPTQTEKPTQPQGKSESKLDQSVRDKLNDLYMRAKKCGLCTNDRQFVSYIRRVLSNPHLDLKAVTLVDLRRVEDDLVTHEMAEAIEQQPVSPNGSVQKAS
jgi:AAA domain